MEVVEDYRDLGIGWVEEGEEQAHLGCWTFSTSLLLLCSRLWPAGEPASEPATPAD